MARRPSFMNSQTRVRYSRRLFSEEQKPDPFTMVIFGATGDLASRKLLPALYGLWHARFLPESFAIVGIGRRDKNDETVPRRGAGGRNQVAPGCAGGEAALGTAFWTTSSITGPIFPRAKE